MTVRPITRTFSLISCVVLLTAAFAVWEHGSESSAADKAAEGPSHQVLACYFHRTVRCPTCLRVGAYIEESLNKRFASQVKDGSVKIVMIDFQDAQTRSTLRHTRLPVEAGAFGRTRRQSDLVEAGSKL